jgi:hypothetical protein
MKTEQEILIMKTEQEILDKWKPIVDYSSKHIEETPEELKQYVSNKLEEWEEKCLEWASSGKISNNGIFPKILIPQVRHSLGNPDIELDVEIDGRLCLVVNNGSIFKYVGKIGIPYNQERGDIYCMTGIRIEDIYVMIDNQWVSYYKSDIWKW